MYIIAVITIIIFLLLIMVSGRENVDSGRSVFIRPFYKISTFLYKRVCMLKWKILDRPEIKIDLKRLNPTTSVEGLCADYYINKIAVALILYFVGTIFCTVLCFNSNNKRILREGNIVQRSKFGEETQYVNLIKDDDKEVYHIEVKPRNPEKGELEELRDDFIASVESIMLGNNSQMDHVTEELNLINELDNYPFYVEWTSSDPEVVSSLGSVTNVENNREVTLHATVYYEEQSWTYTFLITVVPRQLSEDEERINNIKMLLENSELETRDKPDWTLPSQDKGEYIKWSEAVEDNSKYIWCGVVLITFVIFVISDRDLHSKVEKRMDEMKKEYPEIVRKIVLYMSAGMTIRAAFRKIADENKRNPIYGEMMYTCREIQSGISEGAAYERFAKRTGVQDYIRMVSMLQQNLKKGNASVLDRLKEEAAKSSEEKLQNCRKLGEEASTKLLVPMVLMLMVVMLIVIVPTFSSF